MEVNEKGNDEYEIHAHCSKRASVLIKSNGFRRGDFFNNYLTADNSTFTIKSHKRPVIGVSKKCSPHLLKFLKNEGFIFETSSENNGYSIYLDGLKPFNEKDEIRILEKIEQTDSPLIRFWRWPHRCQSALSISGDIDAITSNDFILRLLGE